MEKKAIKVLHVLGSPDDELLYKQSIMLGRYREDYPPYSYKYALIHTNGKMSFPLNLQEETIRECEGHNLAEAGQIITDFQPDVILNQVYGIIGCTRLPAFLEMLGFPIIGPSADKHYITCNKAVTRAFFASSGVSIAPGIEIYEKEDQTYLKEIDGIIGYPCVVKAACVEDSRGVFLVRDRTEITSKVQEAFQLSSTVVIEKFIVGRELRTFVIEEENGNKRFLPVLEFGIKNADIRGYDEKYKFDENGNVMQSSSETWYLDPTEESDTIQILKELSLKAFNTLQLNDFAVFDVRMDENGNAYILEVNLYCAYNDKSFVVKAANHAGITTRQLFENAVNNTIKRNNKQ